MPTDGECVKNHFVFCVNIRWAGAYGVLPICVFRGLSYKRLFKLT